MKSKKPKTKLIWEITKAGCDQFGSSTLADTITTLGVHAVLMTCSSYSPKLLKELRSDLNQRLPVNPHVPADGQIPFLLSFLGRKAYLALPTGDLSVTDGQTIDITLKVDTKACAESPRASSLSGAIEIRVSHPDQLEQLKTGSPLSFSYGAVEAVIDSIHEQKQGFCAVSCVVKYGGNLYSGMEVHSSDMSRDLFPLLPEDETSLEELFYSCADFVIIEGIRSMDELLFIKKIVLGDNSKITERHPTIGITKSVLDKDAYLPPKFLLKIDSKRTLDLFPALIKYVDGIFLSRQELGLDEHPHNLAILQKEIISQCNKQAKTVIVSSELMYSMRLNSTPTRAEVSDMANAAADGADALVLSHELTEGPHSHLVAEVSLETLIKSETWYEKKWHSFEMNEIPSDDDAVTYGAIRIAEQANVDAVVCFTEGGYTAMKLSSMRTPTDIIAITYNKKIMRQLNLLRSVTSVILDSQFHMSHILSKTKDILCNHFEYKKGNQFVFVSLTASSVSDRNSNLFTLQQIE